MIRTHHRMSACVAIVLTTLLSPGAFALGAPVDVTPYTEYSATISPQVLVPTVVEVPVDVNRREGGAYLVLSADGRVVPHLFTERFSIAPVPIRAWADGLQVSTLTDGFFDLGERFAVPPVGEGSVTIELLADAPVSASEITLAYERNTAPPVRAHVVAYDAAGTSMIVYRDAPFQHGSIQFIPTTASRWTVTLTYVQPLTLSEVELVQEDVERTVERGVRFLAQPGEGYSAYRGGDPELIPSPAWGYGDLSSDRGVVRIDPPRAWYANPLYVPPDRDADGVPDLRDNCMDFANADQADIDQNGVGDACEDYDRDGYSTMSDNCPMLPNDQYDADGDGIGDPCDSFEDRVTERLPWVPWAGMGIAALVLIVLCVIVLRDPRLRGNPGA